MDAAGAVVGSVSLAIQVLGGCLKGYSILDDALEMPIVYRYLSIQFHIEHWRLRDFGKSTGLLEGPGHVLDASIAAASPLLLQVFTEVDEVLKSFSADGAVEEQGPAMGMGNHPGRNVADAYRSPLRPRYFTDHSINPSGAFQQLKWSLSRKDKFEQLLRRLKISNDFLYQLLGKQQAQVLLEKQRETNMALVQAQNTIQELKALVQATTLTTRPPNTTPWRRQQHDLDTELENLAAFKALYVSLVQAGVDNYEIMRVEVGDLIFEPETAISSVGKASLKVAGSTPKKVIVDWRLLPEANFESQTSGLPNQELLILLTAPKPTEFCIPPCLGYCELTSPGSQSKLGFILSSPPQVDQNHHPQTLICAINTIPKPSLTERVSLAYNLAHSLMYLHSVNWLHKGLRSENILLYLSTSSNGKSATKLPYLTGFESSRRARFNEDTSEVPRLGHQEIYRHPDIQVNGLGPKCYYRKTFDIYSLGIILLEIAHWKPIASIMGIEYQQIDRYPKATSCVREKILSEGEGVLVRLRGEVGEKYASAVKSCVLARDAFGVGRLDLETDISTSLLIQEGYNAKVVKMLRGILV